MNVDLAKLALDQINDANKRVGDADDYALHGALPTRVRSALEMARLALDLARELTKAALENEVAK
jgi:hypothetical protein